MSVEGSLLLGVHAMFVPRRSPETYASRTDLGPPLARGGLADASSARTYA
jgi:hypothetical protein